MQIFTTLENLIGRYPNIVVALGTFDGVHIGHQKIITKAIELAKEINGTSVVFTFSNHPLSVISPARCPLRISENSIKEKLMQELGVDVLMNIPFTSDFLKLTPLAFLSLLEQNLAPKYIVVGPNYTFGYGGKGKPVHLLQEGARFGFQAEISEAVELDHKIASSTRIRHLISKGGITEVNRLLGKYFSLHCEITYGDQRGRAMGFPTANLKLDERQAIPGNGVYAVFVTVKRQRHQGIANVGVNPTFEGTDKHVEVHIFDFNESIYEEVIEVEFVQKIRNERKFSGPNQLIEQIQSDIAKVKEILGLHSKNFVVK